MPKPVCRYDPECYQKNEEHLKKYSHPKKEAKLALEHERKTVHPATPPAGMSPKKVVSTDSAGSGFGSAPPRKRTLLVQPKLSFPAVKATPPTGTGEAHRKRSREMDDGIEGIDVDKEVAVPVPLASTLTPSKKPSADGAVKEKPIVSPSTGSFASKGSPLKKEDKEESAEDSSSSLLTPPPPRPSALQLPTKDSTLEEVFEMPFPETHMRLVLDVAKAILPSDPARAFMAKAGIRLVGPFQVLLGYAYKSDVDKWTHWRSRYDPPEIQTLFVRDLAGTDSEHFCFHRDSPKDLPKMVVKGTSNGAKFLIVADNVVTAIHQLLPPHSAEASMLEKAFPEVAAPAHGEKATLKHRNSVTIARTISGLGIVVPYVKKTELGYREPMFTTAHFMSLVVASGAAPGGKGLNPKQAEELYDQYRFADIANDEGDFGLGLELGLNMFTAVKRLDSVATNCCRILDTAYQLLDRDLFRHILKCHVPTLVGVRK
jgi:hypothetical protein